MKNRFFKSLAAALLTFVALAAGQTAFAQTTTWSVSITDTENPCRFKIERSGDISQAVTVKYRTVGLSAFEGQHFTAVSGDVTFLADEYEKFIDVAESTPIDSAYMFQNGTSRSYRFEVTDMGGFYLAHCDRTKTTGTSVPSSNVFAVKSVTIGSGEITVTHGGYDQAYHSMIVGNYFNNAAPSPYLQYIGAQLRMTLSFQCKEVDDGWQYVQIYANQETSNFDSGGENGDPGACSFSKYAAGFEHKHGSKDMEYKDYTFPVTSVGDNTGATDPWGHGNQYNLHLQKFNNSRASDGRLIIPTDLTSLYIRFNASGSGGDDWVANNTVAHIQAVDATAPTIINNNDIKVAGGAYGYGNTVYISVPFTEIVTVFFTPTLNTTWGELSYISGSGSNVLTFSGTITANMGTSLTVSSISGIVKDLAGNSYNTNTAINKSFGLTVERPWPGSGSQSDPYIITNTMQLDCLAKRVWDGYYYSGNYFKLGADIAYSYNTEWNDNTSQENNFTSIGGWGCSFNGTFDGDGHSISGIRIYKSGSANTNQCQGLFGMTSSATVKNLVLYDIHIVGEKQVGVIVGSMGGGTIQDCYVYNAHVGATSGYSSCDIIYGSGSSTVTRAYYKDCLKDEPWYGSMLTINNIVKLTLTDNVTVTRTPVTTLNTVTLYNDGVTFSGEEYYTPNIDITLGYNGTVPQGSFVRYAAARLVNYQPANLDDITFSIINGNVLSLPNFEVTVSATILPIVTYLDADGNAQQCSDYTLITSSDSYVGLGDLGKTHWYVVSSDANIDARLEFKDATANLILCDDATLITVGSENRPTLLAKGLNIYGQSQGNGTLNVFSDRVYSAIAADDIGIYGGIVSATCSSSTDGINVGSEGSITLGYTAPANRITASSYRCGSLTVKAGQTLYADDVPYSGDITASAGDLAGKTLAPYSGAGSGTSAVTARKAGFAGVERYWATFYSAMRYALPTGAQAFIMKSDHVLYRIGDGSVIPAGCAVVIMADVSALTNPTATSGIVTLTETTAAEPSVSGNILLGVDSPTAAPSGAYVMSKVGSDFGFFTFTGTIPANKAYYVGE